MTSLEDKLLGEKKEYYCSSSESENEEQSEDENTPNKAKEVIKDPPPFNPSENGSSSNTGPKGVISDWQLYKQKESEMRTQQEKEKLELIHKFSFTCRSDISVKPEEDPELEELLEDPFVLEYSKNKMKEMLKEISNLPKFGMVQKLNSGQDFLDAIDKEKKEVTVVIHIYDNSIADCINMNSCLNDLCKEYLEIKFCSLSASVAGVSKHFKLSGVPALLVYKNGSLIGNFVKISEELGNDFSANDVKNFLIEHGILLDASFVPKIVRHSLLNNIDDEID